MPFVSESQRRWGNSPAGVKALGGKKHVDEWNKATEGRRLPERVKKHKLHPSHPANRSHINHKYYKSGSKMVRGIDGKEQDFSKQWAR